MSLEQRFSRSNPTIHHNESIAGSSGAHPDDNSTAKLATYDFVVNAHHINETASLSPRQDLPWSRIRHAMREPFSEFFGVFVLVLFGEGAIAQVVLSRDSRGDWQSICWGWSMGLMLAVYVAGASGGHVNPAVTFANCVFRKHPWKKFPTYVLAQVLGGMCASAVVYANYRSAIDMYEGGPGIRTVPDSMSLINGNSSNASSTATAGIFATYPVPFMSRGGCFLDEFIASTMLMFCLYALQDNGNVGAGKLTPLGLFFVMFGIGSCFGWETGFAINLARDFGPRLVTYFLGYGHDVWSAGGYYFWIPMLAPFFGCMFGALVYDIFLYTGDSPINTPWMGLRDVYYRVRHGVKAHDPESLSTA